jgi:ATP-dependent Clp protease ATP-binding subunit ClpA
VGSGHLLGGILAEAGNLALHVLRAVEIEPERVERELAHQPSGEPATLTEAGSPRFDATASAALELAVTEATAFGHNYVGCEHLLLGLIAEPDGTAGQVLRSFGAKLRLTRKAVAAALAGYVHLRPPPPHAAGGGDPEQAAVLTAVIRNELQPLVQRIERLEAQGDAVTER